VPHPGAARLAGGTAGLSPEQKKTALAAYLGLCTFVDDQIGRVLGALDAAGLAGSTRVVYTSDHGESAGSRGMWGKSVMYEEACGIPLIVAGDDVPRGRVCATPVSLVDAYPTILQGAGLPAADDELPGCSWFDLASEADDPGRLVFSEYHAMRSPSGAFMLRQGRYKFHYYVGYAPELFDIEADPEETTDLAGDPAYGAVCADYLARLREIVDPEATDTRAKADQKALVERHGGPEAVTARAAGGKSFTEVPPEVQAIL
jgi:choline-sulfatase